MKKDLQSLYKKYLEIKSPQGQNMADGGKVASEDSTFQDLADAFKKAFSTPKPAPTPDPTLQDKYDKIRQQNRKNFDEPAMYDGGLSSTHMAQYTDGGQVDDHSVIVVDHNPQSQEERDAESEEITHNEDQKKLQDDAEAKELQDQANHKSIGNYFSEGGKVEHDKKNLLELKAAFDKFLSEEGKEKLFSGGKVGSGERFASLENKLSHEKGVTDPGALAASIGRKKYGNAKMNKMAKAHMADGGSVGMGDVKDAERKDTMPSLSESLGESFEYTKRHPEPSPTPKKYADGGEVNMAAPNNGKLPYYQPHDQVQLYKKYLALNQPQHFDGSDGSVVQPDPNLMQQYQKLYPGVPPDQIMKMIQATPPPAPAKAPIPTQQMMEDPGSGGPSNTGSLAGNVSDQLNQLQASNQPAMADGGEVPVDNIQQELADASDPNNFPENPEDTANLSPHLGPMRDENDNLSGPAEEAKAEEMSDAGITPDENGNVAIDGDKALEKQKSDIADAVNAKHDQQSDLQQAQNARDQMIAQQQVTKGAALLGAGIAGRSGARVDPSAALNIASEGDKYVNLPVQKYNEQIANQQNDPNSSVSQAAKTLYKKVTGSDAPDSWSAADLAKVDPIFAHYAQIQSQNETKKEIAKQRAQQASQFHEEMNFRKDQAQQNKDNADFEHMVTKGTGEIASSRSPFGRAANRVQQAENLEGIINQYDDRNGLDSRQIAEIATGLNSMLSNGASTISGTEHFIPKTALGSAAKIEEFISGLPVGVQQKEFVDRLAETIAREKRIANGQMLSTQGKIFSGWAHLKEKYPDRYNQTLKEMGVPSEADGYTKDVMDYSKKHGITPDEALALKNQRTGGQ